VGVDAGGGLAVPVGEGLAALEEGATVGVEPTVGAAVAVGTTVEAGVAVGAAVGVGVALAGGSADATVTSAVAPCPSPVTAATV
jgi:hypothetical protein